MEQNLRLLGNSIVGAMKKLEEILKSSQNNFLTKKNPHKMQDKF